MVQQTTGALEVYRKMADPVAAMQTLGRDIALSKAFGEISAAQGTVIAMECMSRGVPPLSLKQKFHFTPFGLIPQASDMLAEFHRAGGKSKQISRTADLAEIELSIDGQTQRFRLTWEDAQKEPFPYAQSREIKEKDILAMLAKGERPPLKPKYATPLSRTQMLYWRLVADSIRSLRPEVNGGMYCAEEIADADAGEPIDAEYTVSEPATANGSGHAGRAEPSATGVTACTVADGGKGDEVAYCSVEQSKLIHDLLDALQATPEQREKMLVTRGVKAVRSLTVEQAAELVAKLQERIAAKTAGESKAAPAKAGEPQPNNGPSDAMQVDRAKSLLKEMEQRAPGTIAKLQAKLKEAGLTAIADLTWQDCEHLLTALSVKNMDLFFTASLTPKQSAGN